MKELLAEIQDGSFAKQWILENKAGRPSFNAMRRQQADTQVEEVGRELRAMMRWLNEPSAISSQPSAVGWDTCRVVT